MTQKCEAHFFSLVPLSLFSPRCWVHPSSCLNNTNKSPYVRTVERLRYQSARRLSLMSSSIENHRGGPSPRKQRYERLARDEIRANDHHHHEQHQRHSEDDANLVIVAASHPVDDSGDIETSSLVGDKSNTTTSGIFRSNHASWDDEDAPHQYSDPTSTKGETILDSSSSNSSNSSNNNNNQNNNSNSLSSSLHVMLSRSKSHESSSDNNDPEFSDWDYDDDDDEDGIRRYHLETANNNNNNNNNTSNNSNNNIHRNIPLPAEFSYKSSSWPRRLWQAFLELRTAARQRRAARLLTMPLSTPTTQSLCITRYQAVACLLTSCCDATDLGIVLVAVWLSLWLLIGVAAGMGTMWWLVGFTLFVVRISARRVLEFCQRRKRRQRQRLSSTEVVEFGHAHMPIATGVVGVDGVIIGGGFRDKNNSDNNIHAKSSDHRGDFDHGVL